MLNHDILGKLFRDRKAPDGSSVADNFSVWFGQSEAIDAKGRPRVMYHGTEASFDAFEKTPIYLARSQVDASNYGARILALYVRMEKPVFLDDDKFRMLAWRPQDVARLIAKGYDGAQSREGGALAVFHASHVKAVKANSGRYELTSHALCDAPPDLSSEDARRAHQAQEAMASFGTVARKAAP